MSDDDATVALTAATVGYGTWSAGWLCDETSGNLSAAFGTLTAHSVPTYSNSGPRDPESK